MGNWQGRYAPREVVLVATWMIQPTMESKCCKDHEANYGICVFLHSSCGNVCKSFPIQIAVSWIITICGIELQGFWPEGMQNTSSVG